MTSVAGQVAVGGGVIFGEKGLRKVRYLGDVNGKHRGAISCQWYEFSREKRIRYVDVRDVAQLTARKGAQGEMMFEAAD